MDYSNATSIFKLDASSIYNICVVRLFQRVSFVKFYPKDSMGRTIYLIVP